MNKCMRSFILCVAITLLFNLLVRGATWYDASTGLRWTYTVKEGKASVGGGNSQATAVPASTCGSIKIPSIIAGYPVVEIGCSAFCECKGLTSVTIPEGVMRIAGYAFDNCSSMSNIMFPLGLKDIGEYAFAGCNAMTMLTIPPSVTNVGFYAFSNCKGLESVLFSFDTEGLCWMTFPGCYGIKNVTILNGEYDLPIAPTMSNVFKDSCASITNVILSDGVANIPAGEFQDLSGLRTITIPESVNRVADRAFVGCSSLTSIEFPKGVADIGEDVFRGCANLVSVTVGDNLHFKSVGGVLFTRDLSRLIFCPRDVSGAYSIPERVVSVGGGAFSDCCHLSRVTFPFGIRAVGDHAFEGCTNLVEAALPEGVTKVGERAFFGCNASMEVSIPSSVDRVGAYAFGDYSNFSDGFVLVDGCVLKMKGDCPSSVTIPNGARLIADKAFYECSGLTTIKIPSSVRNIGSWAFYDCDALSSVTIPSGVRSIEECAFVHCSALGSVIIEEGVLSIGEDAFSYCRKLSNLTLPSSVTNIGAYAFSFTNLGSGVVVINGCVLAVNSDVSGEITLPMDTRLVVCGAFSYYCTGVTAINMPENDNFRSVDGVLYNKDCTELIAYPPGKVGGYTISSSVTRVRPHLFRGCNNKLETFTFEGVPPAGIHDCEISLYRPIVYNKKYEDRWLPIIKECGFRNAVSNSFADALPDIGDSPSTADVSAVVANATDQKVTANIDETNYNDFRSWAGKVKTKDGSAAGAQGVMDAQNAWLSYALGQGSLLGMAPTDEDLSVEAFAPSTEFGKFDFTVSVKDIEVGSEAAKENLKKVFGLEGAATLEGAAFSTDKVDIEFGTPVDGKVKFTAGPKDANAETFFMKVKLNP